MDRVRRIEELAALLDGEIRDAKRAEELYNAIRSDKALKAEFELQREVKTLLAKVSLSEAPAYLDTRVLARIGERRGMRPTSGTRAWAAALGAFALLVLGAGGLMQIFKTLPAPEKESIVARQPATMTPPGLIGPTDDMFTPQNWDEDIDPALRDFLIFASEAHKYRQLTLAVDRVSPDIPAAIFVLNEGEGR
ncbi:hypothetical protein IIA79_08200 [bacterium]|nr:hypothetical protein [bacterium]